MVDFVGGEGGVEGDLDVGGEGDVLHLESFGSVAERQLRL